MDRQGVLRRAEKSFQAALTVQFTHAESYRWLATVQCLLAQYDDADKNYEQAADKNYEQAKEKANQQKLPERFQYVFEWAEAPLRRKKPDLAEARSRAKQLDGEPQNESARLFAAWLRGDLKQAEGDIEGACREYESVLPGDVDAMHGYLLFSRAVARWTDLQRSDPNDRQRWAKENKGKCDSAVADLEKCFTLVSGRQTVAQSHALLRSLYYLKAKMEDGTEYYQQSLLHVERAIELAPRGPQVSEWKAFGSALIWLLMDVKEGQPVAAPKRLIERHEQAVKWFAESKAGAKDPVFLRNWDTNAVKVLTRTSQVLRTIRDATAGLSQNEKEALLARANATIKACARLAENIGSGDVRPQAIAQIDEMKKLLTQ